MSENFFEITLSPVTRRILSFILLCCIIFFIGLFAKNYFCKKIFSFFESLLKRIPIVKTIYLSAKQIINTFLNSNGDNFSKVVLIEYPRQGIYSIAFLTNNTIPFFSNALEKKCVNVFVPTSPNPTSGFLLVIPESDIINLDMSIEDGFNYVISAGLIVPERVQSASNIKIIKE